MYAFRNFLCVLYFAFKKMKARTSHHMNNRMIVYLFQNVPALFWFLTRQTQGIYPFTKTPRPALRPTEPLNQCVAVFFPEGKTAGA